MNSTTRKWVTGLMSALLIVGLVYMMSNIDVIREKASSLAAQAQQTFESVEKGVVDGDVTTSPSVEEGK